MSKGSSTSPEVGALSEAWAERYLITHGLQPIDRNYRWRGGEIDLIMREGQDTLVFVEVRYRARSLITAPEETVNATKRRKVVTTARHYLAKHPQLHFENARFDVIGLSGALDEPQARWVRDAFRADAW
ncbi:MAG: YraN family protein [Pseudomonadota bacterium]